MAFGIRGCFYFLDPMTEAQALQLVSDAVPVGSTRAECEEWLNSRGLKWHFTEADDFVGSTLEAHGWDTSRRPRYYFAWIKRTGRSLLTECDMAIYIMIGPDGRVVDHVVDESCTSL